MTNSLPDALSASVARIHRSFAAGKVFIPFFTCGDPDLETTANCVRAAIQAGAGPVEFGMPFSDPMAEGPVIQAASARAIAGGATTDKIFAMIAQLREEFPDTPFITMGYANSVFSYGIEKWSQAAAAAGVDGAILADVPHEESTEFAPTFAAHGISLIPLIAPTSKERIAQIAASATGFIYVVSSLGVTGVRSEITTDIGSIVRVIRDTTQVPSAVGFGVSTPEQASQMSARSDGVIVGSAIVRLIHESGPEKAPQAVGEYVTKMVAALQ
ncbi:tryptophan synthase, alpha chain [Actinobaculum suis]|uniref:Tryptophan synthase alpha chain n=1 Tax=Actinobaculum suis TaxID=1657 RepID=A0A0K9EVN8_9ACTO|nr:tryptophan synthase subunit alpha [Actinobaculum suis]KMY23947.1 tryptophan synthase subunit alpha [Actinobaculum suis]MDY5153399.1 tryptophan synthase subunit alpha [Actinobaculum suis]OCA93371.1 tryptophan synthase subunit alpha [Actinobaculum suis]OCA94292.1 tryptophan synthase subunit alpha [Actinobaculum suis]SDE17012.1 tryptophan synthase, alpha chain [Actinobaculum suis]